MSVLLLFSPQEVEVSEHVGAAPSWDLNFEIDGTVDWPMAIGDVDITYNLLNRDVARCSCIDKRDDTANALRPTIEQRLVIVSATKGRVFNGIIANVSDAPVEDPKTGVRTSIEAIDWSWSAAESRIITNKTYGGDPIPLAIAAVGTPTTITTREPHGLTTGDKVIIADDTETVPTVNGTHTVTVTGPYNVTIPVNVTTAGGGTATIRKVTTLSAIVTDLRATYLAAAGITLGSDLTTVDGPLIEKLVLDGVSVIDAFKKLVEMTGGTWVFRFTPYQVLEWWEVGTRVVPWTADSPKIRSGLRWSKARGKFGNTVYLKYGKDVLVNKEQVFTGDGANRLFPLSYRPAAAIEGVYDYAAAAWRHVGTYGVDTLFEWVYDKDYGANGALRQLDVSAGAPNAPLAAGAAVKALFAVQFPQEVIEPDAALVALQGPRDVRRTAPDIYDEATARQVAKGILNQTKINPRTATFPSRHDLAIPGWVMPLVEEDRGISASNWLIRTTQFSEDEDGVLAFNYDVLEGEVAIGGWQDALREMFGGGGNQNASGTISGTLVPGAGGGAPFSYDAGLLVGIIASAVQDQITRTGTLVSGATGAGFTIALSASTVTGTLADARLSSNVPLKNAALNAFTGNMTIAGTLGVTGAATVGSLDVGGAATVGTTLGVGGAVTLLSTISALGAGTFSSTVSIAGTLTVPTITATADLTISPVGDIITNPTGKELVPNLGYDISIGRLTKKYLSLHAAELWVETLVAQNTIATIGGRILVAPTNLLTADLASGATSITVKYNNFFNNEVVYMEADGKVEFMRVTTSAPTGGAGAWVYSVTRNLDGTGANDWFAGDALLNTGQTGNGFIDIYSVRGIRAGTEIGPAIVGNVRNSSTFNDWTPRWAIGNLNGLYGYIADTYGAAFGVATGAWLKIDATNGVRIGHNATTFAHITAAGSATFTGSITITGGSGYANLSDKPTSLAGINSAEGTKLGGIAAGATVGATWGTNLSGIPAPLTPAGPAGLYLSTTHLGYWNGSTWRTFMDNSGNFYLGGTSGALTWNGTSLVITGSGYFSGTLVAGSGTVTMDTSGIVVSMPSAYADVNSYRFSSGMSGATIGLYGQEASGTRYVAVLNTITNASQACYSFIQAQNSGAGLTASVSAFVSGFTGARTVTIVASSTDVIGSFSCNSSITASGAMYVHGTKVVTYCDPTLWLTNFAAQAGYVQASHYSAGAIGWNYFLSDARLKDAEGPVEDDAIAALAAIQFKSFRYRKGIGFDDYPRVRIGFDAQNLRAIRPEFVFELQDDDKTLIPNTTALIQYTMKAVVDLHQRVLALERNRPI